MDFNKSRILSRKYEIGKLLGQGTFAKVYHGRSIESSQSVAIKVVDKERVVRAGLVDQLKREISVMRLVRHPNIVQLYEVLATKSKIYFVMEQAKGGELFHKVAKGRLKEKVALKYFRQLVNTVDFCHSRGVYHRDIKPENLLLDENENMKITDFGLSALAECRRQDGLLHTTCGTPAYVAPEVISRKGYDGAKADIWSCGVVLFVLLAGYLPFHDTNLMEMYRKIGRAEFKCPSWFPTEARRLLGRMLDPNPSTRISLAKIKECYWFRKGLDCVHPKNDSSKHKHGDDPTPPGLPPPSPPSLLLHRNGSGPSGTNSLHRNGSGPSGTNSLQCECADGNDEATNKLHKLNAFDIIALSVGFDLSGLFKGMFLKKDARFSSRKSASAIISKLEDVARSMKLKIMKKADGLLKMDGAEEGRKGLLSIDAEIFEVAPNFHLVEMKKCNGDTLEFHKVVREARPALQDIVWVWQGDQEAPLPQQEQQLLHQPSQSSI